MSITFKYLIVIVIAVVFISCAASYSGLKFKSPPAIERIDTNYYVMTSDGVKHSFSEEDKLTITNKTFALKNNVSFPSSDVIGYKYNYKKGTMWVSEYRRVGKKTFAKKIINGSINVYTYLNMYTSGMDNRAHGTTQYYVQKGESMEPIMLIPQNAKGAIYEWLSDYDPSRKIMDDYLKKKKIIDLKEVVEAINAYNNR